MSDIKARKADHIALCETDEVAFQQKTNLLDDLELVHDALPELHLDEVDLSTTFAGKALKAPLIIAAMTGGVERAATINRDMATIAERYGIGFGFGSQRPLLEQGITLGYEVREQAPTALVLGNIGVVQAARASSERLAEVVAICGADALCVHLNPAMEVIQPEGDRDFRGGLDTIARLVEELPVPVVVKETGCGLSRSVGERVAGLGVEWVDTSGAGGTSWVGVETLRATEEGTRPLGRRFWDWGIPTAASVAQLSGLGLGICATGGISDGLMAARAIALGARCAGVARPFLQAWAAGGLEGADAAVRRFLEELKLAHLLAGARTPEALRAAPLVVGPRLNRWIPRAAPLRRRIVGP
jgi:isopentenyl-diphosphate delta-isomerase